MSNDITVVVPYYNEIETIESTLDKIGNQTVPIRRALLINSSSTDETSAIVDAWIENNKHKYPVCFENIFENTSNPGSSKNVGVQNADSEWIAFMDCGLEFDIHWLETQSNYVINKNVDVVFGVVSLSGVNWVDRCAVAQTYGYKRNRPCVPSSLVRRSVFNKTGLFHIGRRSGYDMAWRLKLNKIGIKCVTNEDAKITYIGENYAITLLKLFNKAVLYARPALGLDGYPIPYYYLLSLSLFLFVAIQSYMVAIVIFLAYLLFRIFVTPVFKSKGFLFYKEYPFEAILGLGIVGLVIDMGKIVGYFFGIMDYLKKKLKLKKDVQ